MPNYGMQSNNDRRGVPQRKRVSDDHPPMSRLFVICSKFHTEEHFRQAFSQYGEIEDIWVLKDKATGENKGVTYIKFAKTSDAARAQEELNGQKIGNLDKVLKVVVAANRAEGSGKAANEHEKYVRLFLVVSRGATEQEIYGDFVKYGTVEDVNLVRDKFTGELKGFAFVRFSKFYNAALAFENCPAHYKAVFAEPKGTPAGATEAFTSRGEKRNNMGWRVADSYNGGSYGRGAVGTRYPNIRSSNWNFANDTAYYSILSSIQNSLPPPRHSNYLDISCSNAVSQEQLWRLFDIIPGLEDCQILGENGPRSNKAVAVYSNPRSAIYARDKLHGLEYPMGEPLIVKLNGKTPPAIASFMNNNRNMASICDVPLPPPQPMASPNAQVAQRLFIVLEAQLPQSILRHVFSCWPGLIDVYLLPNKNCGYVKYAEAESAAECMLIMNGAQICGNKIKVVEAEERNRDVPYSQPQRNECDESSQPKRIKVEPEEQETSEN